MARPPLGWSHAPHGGFERWREPTRAHLVEHAGEPGIWTVRLEVHAIGQPMQLVAQLVGVSRKRAARWAAAGLDGLDDTPGDG
jgi:hypothetical protein